MYIHLFREPYKKDHYKKEEYKKPKYGSKGKYDGKPEDKHEDDSWQE